MISGTTKARSSVFLLGIDESVALLGDTYDIDEWRLHEDMKSYNAHQSYSELKITGQTKKRYLELGESNAFMITNAVNGDSQCLLSARKLGNNAVLVTNDDDDSEIIESIDEPSADSPRIRKDFRETWIFEDLKADSNGKFSLRRKLPDTITSFLVSGFSVHPDTGLGIAVQQKVTVFQDFFIKLNLPYSIRFGEILKVDVTIFYYVKSRLKKVVTVDVKMFNEDEEFEFVDAEQLGNICNIVGSGDGERTRNVKISNGVGSTFFLIRALITGQIKIKVRATSTKYGDEIEKFLVVEHEGRREVKNNPYLIDLRNRTHDGKSFNIPIPQKGVILKSINIQASAIGDLLGPALVNIQKLM